MTIFLKIDWVCMARKKSTSQGPVYFDPSDSDSRAMTRAPAGDYYGMGIKNPVGKIRESTVGQEPVSEKGLKKPPKSLA